MACPEGQYFCNDRGKCMPIPKGHKVRKDGELVKEVAPPGWGHTKAEKEKTDPSKPKSKIGGSAAAFDRARKEGRFKGSKEDMFKLMWWMKNKGGKPKGKPHYKPGTDEKYKKYQEEDWKPEIEVIDTKKEAKKREKKRKEAESSLPPHLRLDTMKKAFAHTNESVMPNVSPKDRGAIKKRAKNLFKKDLTGEHPSVNEASAVLDANTKIKNKEDRKKKEKEYARLNKQLQHMKKLKELGLESFEIDPKKHRKEKTAAKIGNLYRKTKNEGEKAAAERKLKGPKLMGEEQVNYEGFLKKAADAMKKVATKKDAPKHDYGKDAGAEAAKRLRKKDHETVNFLDPDD